jgi:hypothetical protein
MKKWQKRFMALIVALGYSEQVKAGTLTADEQKLIFAKYEETHNISFEADKALDEPAELEENLLSADQLSEIALLMDKKPEQLPKGKKEVIDNLIENGKDQKQKIEKLSGEPEEFEPKKVNMKENGARMLATVLGHTPHSATHLFGIESDVFATSKWYNQLMITGKANENITEEDEKVLMSDFRSYAKSFTERFRELRSTNQIHSLDYKQMISGNGSVDYSNLSDTVAGLAGEYVIRRSDLIIAYLRTIPTVSDIFPVISNVQNKEVAPTVSFGELSQGYRKGRHFKGNLKFAAEVYKVDDVMFKFEFTDMIDLEKQYIGYKNENEGSAIIKWTFIEWILINFSVSLVNEQNLRRVEGVFVPQQNVASNPFLLGADGVIRAIERVEESLKVLPFDDLKVYTNSSMLAYATNLFNYVTAIVPSTAGMQIYANLKHKQWYIELWSDKYGQYTGTIVNASQLPDLHPDKIIWVPNMSNNNYKMWMTTSGNVCNDEDKPGEMLAFKFTDEFESTLAKSRWKEGGRVRAAGVKYKTLAELVASERKMQWLFTNNPASALALGATVSFAANSLFEITGGDANGVTTVNGVDESKVYKLVATDAFATTLLKKIGAFSKITADFDPVAAGDYIKVYAELEDYEETIEGEVVTLTRKTGKFLELERKVTA